MKECQKPEELRTQGTVSLGYFISCKDEAVTVEAVRRMVSLLNLSRKGET